MLIRERLALMMGVLDSVTPKVWRDESLLRILTERKVRLILSLRHPCPDRAIMSFIGTWCLREGYGFFITRCYGKVYHDLVYKPVGKMDPRGGQVFWISEGWKGILYKNNNLLPSFLYRGRSGGHLISTDLQMNLQTQACRFHFSTSSKQTVELKQFRK